MAIPGLASTCSSHSERARVPAPPRPIPSVRPAPARSTFRAPRAPRRGPCTDRLLGFLIVGGSLLAAGCALPGEPGGGAAGGSTCPDAFSRTFAYASLSQRAQPLSSETLDGIGIERLRLAWQEEGGGSPLELEVARFRPRCDGPCPGALVLPILEGGGWISESIARSLARRGIECLVLADPGPVFDPGAGLERLRDVILQRVVEARRALDWWLRSPSVDAGRVGLVGVSFGAIVGALVMEADARPAAAALVLGGADLPLLIARSRERDVRRYRGALLEREGWNRARLRREAQAVLGEVDPSRCPEALGRRPLLLVEARFDSVVPRESSQALWRGAGRPARVVYPTGHYSLLVFLPDVKRRLADHLASALGSEER